MQYCFTNDLKRKIVACGMWQAMWQQILTLCPKCEQFFPYFVRTVLDIGQNPLQHLPVLMIFY